MRYVLINWHGAIYKMGKRQYVRFLKSLLNDADSLPEHFGAREIGILRASPGRFDREEIEAEIRSLEG